MASEQHVLVTGVTGFMGGSILHSILKSSLMSGEQISVSVTVRGQHQADILKAYNVTPLLLSDLDDTEHLSKIAEDFDIIIHSTNGYHAASAKALIEGLGKRQARHGKAVHYIHNSGTSNLGDQPFSGTHIEQETRSFSDEDDIYAYEKARELKEPYPQRSTGVTVIETGQAHKVQTYIVMSPLVYGRGTGLFNKTSIQIPLLIRDAIRHKQPAYIGDGSGVWDHVHAEDMAALFTLILAKVLSGETVPSDKKGYYFVDSGKPTWKDIALGIADAGVQLGLFETKDASSITLQEAGKRWLNGNEQLAELGFASRSVTSGSRSRRLGWKPLKTEADWQINFIETMRYVLEGQ